MSRAQGTSTSVDENKASFRRIPERIYNRGEMGLSAEVMTDDYVEHIPLPAGFSTGRVGFDQFVEMFRVAVPDLTYTVTHFTPDDLIGDGDHVVHHVEGRGTHLGELFGIPPSGRALDWTETHIGRYAGGMLVEHWGQIDVLRILQGVGAVPGYTPRGPAPIPPAVADERPLSTEAMRGLMTRPSFQMSSTNRVIRPRIASVDSGRSSATAGGTGAGPRGA